MLRITQSSNEAGAKSYYGTADYYSEGQELTGRWRGKGAARLGLAGEVGEREWDMLCGNRHPESGEPLTPRNRGDRRIGYDFNFHAPKSLSLLYGATGDERLLEAFRNAVDVTMRDMEAEMQTRVRAGGKDEDRSTGNMVYGEFTHFTARPVDGVPGPHLHAHCFVFNTTYDGKERRWKAGQFAGLKRDAPYFEAAFHSRLARGMEELGLPVARTRTGWEIAGLSPATLRKFSRRTALIEEKAREKGITDPEAKSDLGARTRERKRPGMSMDELRREWLARLTPDEGGAVSSAALRLGSEGRKENDRLASEAVDLAMSHCFERDSVVPERRLVAEALKRSFGTASPETIAAAVADRQLIWASRDGVKLVTTREVLEEERQMIAFAREGRGTCPMLGDPKRSFARDWLTGEQREAVKHVLGSRDRVTLIRGAAGTGKTTMMKEAVEAIEACGHRVLVFAPTAEASRSVLREQEQFAGADTVARLLVDDKLQDSARDQVIWIDEAGLLGSRTMAKVFDLADRLDARVVLSGDRYQHGSVERGAALKLLEEEAGIIPAELRTIRRQQDEYRRAVQALSDGRTASGFRQLDRLSWIKEVPDEDRYRALAQDYLASIGDGKTALVVAPTHKEGEAITGEIRGALKRSGRLKGGEREFTMLKSANLTEAERADAVNYSPGDVLVFHQNAKGRVKGDRVTAEQGEIPLDQAARFQVFHSGTLPIAPGDILRITRNGRTVEGAHRLNNGSFVTVKGFTPGGDIRLTNDWVIAKDYGHLAHGYCVTSHASQGKTVQHVFIGQSSDSFPASSQAQFYVSASRGRERCTVYTSSRKELLEAVSRSDDRLTATELVSQRDSRARRHRLERQRRLRSLDERQMDMAQQAERDR